MCTLSWRFSAASDRYDVRFNRDEINGRSAEMPPAAGTTAEGRTYVAPRDGDHLGTWLAVNDAGLTVCLLNDYGCRWQPSDTTPRQSRGRVVTACAGAGDGNAVGRMLHAQSLQCVRPFHLFAFSLRDGVRFWHWGGAELLEAVPDPAAPPVFSSSSFRTAEVIAARVERFPAFTSGSPHAEAPELDDYHHQHDPETGAHSVLMRRPDACTRSISHIRVDRLVSIFEYTRVDWPASPRGRPAFATVAHRLDAVSGEFFAPPRCLTAVSTP